MWDTVTHLMYLQSELKKPQLQSIMIVLYHLFNTDYRELILR